MIEKKRNRNKSKTSEERPLRRIFSQETIWTRTKPSAPFTSQDRMRPKQENKKKLWQQRGLQTTNHKSPFPQSYSKENQRKNVRTFHKRKEKSDAAKSQQSLHSQKLQSKPVNLSVFREKKNTSAAHACLWQIGTFYGPPAKSWVTKKSVTNSDIA